MRFFKTIKFRLTIWYVVVLGVLLLLFSAMAFILLSHRLYWNLDNSLRTRSQEIELSLYAENGYIDPESIGQFDLQQQLGELLLLYDARGNLVQHAGPTVEIQQIDTLVSEALDGYSSLVSVEVTQHEKIRLYVAPVGSRSTSIDAVLIVGRSTGEIDEVLDRFRDVLLIAVATTIVMAGGGGLFLADRAFKPVEHITETAQEIEEGDLSRRVEVRSDDEMGRLASTLNQMIERLEKAFNRQRQFTADASHELRTPLAVIEAESTLALRKERTQEDYQKSLDLIYQETSYMTATLDKLLMLARADAGKEQVSFETVNLKDLLSDVASDVEILCREKDLNFQLGQLDNLIITGDPIKLKQLFLNLLDNALRYTPASGTVSLSLTKEGRSAVVAVSDTGIGIPEEHIPQIFERFYRVDKARSRSEKGSGLGLSICKYIVEVHSGSITVESEVGKGSTFSVYLPLRGKR
jgi:heavy metal sensor kinase